MSEAERLRLEVALINYRLAAMQGRWADADRIYYTALNKPLPHYLQEQASD